MCNLQILVLISNRKKSIVIKTRLIFHNELSPAPLAFDEFTQSTYCFLQKSNSLLVFFCFVHFSFILTWFDLVQSRLITSTLFYMVNGCADSINFTCWSPQRRLVRWNQLPGFDLLAIFSSDDCRLKLGKKERSYVNWKWKHV